VQPDKKKATIANSRIVCKKHSVITDWTWVPKIATNAPYDALASTTTSAASSVLPEDYFAFFTFSKPSRRVFIGLRQAALLRFSALQTLAMSLLAFGAV